MSGHLSVVAGCFKGRAEPKQQQQKQLSVAGRLRFQSSDGVPAWLRLPRSQVVKPLVA
jgi:hypothetical protein